MSRKRKEFPGLMIDNDRAEEHFDFYDVHLREYYRKALLALYELKDLEGRILEVGSGPGVFGMMLCDRNEFSTVIGLEPSGILIRIGEAVSVRRGYGGRVSFKLWEGNELPFGDNEFDAVVSVLSLHRWDRPDQIFSEIERVRKKDSVVMITDFRRDRFLAPISASAGMFGFGMSRINSRNLKNSLKSSYTAAELEDIIRAAGIGNWNITKNGRLLSVMTPPVTSADSA